MTQSKGQERVLVWLQCQKQECEKQLRVRHKPESAGHIGHGKTFTSDGGNIKQDKCLEGKVAIKIKKA